MPNLRESIQKIQTIAHDAYRASSQAATLLNEQGFSPEVFANSLEQTASQMEHAAVELRALCESCLPELLTIGRMPVLPPLMWLALSV